MTLFFLFCVEADIDFLGRHIDHVNLARQEPTFKKGTHIQNLSAPCAHRTSQQCDFM